MIKVEFNPPDSLPGSILLRAADLTDAPALALKLRDADDALSPFLRSKLSPTTLQQLQSYDPPRPLPAALRDALVTELNDALQGSAFHDRTRFRGAEWRKERQVILPGLIKLKPQGDALTCLNRLLAEEVYRGEIAASLKAEWCAWTQLTEDAKLNVIRQWEHYKAKSAKWKEGGRQGEQPTFKAKLSETLWRGFRDWLKLNVFHNKCAYCESTLTANPGDTEHFRPKNSVRVRRPDGTFDVVKVVDEDGEEIPHPGYFWLAYHWQNLLPSCKYCNSGGGKNDLFPVRKAHVAAWRAKDDNEVPLTEWITQSLKWPDIYYPEPRDLDLIEKRILLHPVLDNPEEYICFDTEGLAKEWCGSEEGKKSIEVFNLNEDTKRDARRTAQDEARRFYALDIVGIRVDKLDDLKRAAESFFNDYYDGPKPYAAAVFDFLHDRFEHTRYDPAALLGERRRKM